MYDNFQSYSADQFAPISGSAKTSLRQCLTQRGLYVSTELALDISEALYNAIQTYTTWPTSVERPLHNPKNCPRAPFSKNRIYTIRAEHDTTAQTPLHNATQDIRNNRNEQDQVADTNGTRNQGINIRHDRQGNINVTTQRRERRREEIPCLGQGLRSGSSPWGTSPISGSSQELKKLKQVENMGKAYNNEYLKFR